jgi:hypothetical protein
MIPNKMRQWSSASISKLLLSALMLFALSCVSAQAQGLIGKGREEALQVLEQMASVEQGGVRSGSCLRPIGDIGTEEFAVYLLLPVSRIEGFVIEMSGDDGAATEVVANAGIASFTESGDTAIRGNLGLDWVAEAYRVAANFIRQSELHLDDSYEQALSRLPTEQCPVPYSQRVVPTLR